MILVLKEGVFLIETTPSGGRCIYSTHAEGLLLVKRECPALVGRMALSTRTGWPYSLLVGARQLEQFLMWACDECDYDTKAACEAFGAPSNPAAVQIFIEEKIPENTGNSD